MSTIYFDCAENLLGSMLGFDTDGFLKPRQYLPKCHFRTQGLIIYHHIQKTLAIGPNCRKTIMFKYTGFLFSPVKRINNWCHFFTDTVHIKKNVIDF